MSNQNVENAQGAAPEPERGSWLSEMIQSVLPALVIVVVVNLFIAQATRVEGQSMEPNLHNNERLIIEKVSYHFRQPARGDIVVLKPQQEGSVSLIKRVIGLPGETVEIHDDHVLINGQPLQEDYLTEPTLGDMTARVVPPEHVLVLGDNRDASNDSRSFGMIPYADLVGRAWFRYWPLQDIGLVH
ncbi:MAG: signal peptidase I [Anaerolineae bacterium]|jgi:signal peptidase I|nr:signal peptidase I [Chloroflexota bacterium]